MKASVVICTRDRADSLTRTLESFNAVEVPAGLQTEILVVDNGSKDNTREVVKKHSSAKFSVRYLLESAPGLCRARNAGAAQSAGEFILYTDDDVIPAKNWLDKMLSPLVLRKFDGVQGRIELATEVRRPWMTSSNVGGLAMYDGPGNGTLVFVGANMGVHRSVFDRVPAFDPELDAGALGFAGDTLFSWQLAEAGFRLSYLPEASVIHAPDPLRLLRRNGISFGRKIGASEAYILHHWEHVEIKSPRLRLCYVGIKLALRRRIQPPGPLDAEGIAGWETSYIREIEQYRQFLLERERPRNYTKRGLSKLRP